MAKWQNKKLRAAMQRKLPDWFRICDLYNPPGPDRVTRLRKKRCPSCLGKTLFCCRNDFGHVDTEPKFVHICVNPKCDYVAQHEEHGVEMSDIEATREYCPWCNGTKLQTA